MLRATRQEDLPAVRELERAAGAAFRDLDMAAVADDEPPSIYLLIAAVDRGPPSSPPTQGAPADDEPA